MKPALVFPFVVADPLLMDHLQTILTDLKEHFERIYISTLRSADFRFQEDDFFVITLTRLSRSRENA